MDSQALDTLLDFMNSHHTDDVHGVFTDDLFATPELAAGQLIAVGLIDAGATVTATEARLLQRVRDAINSLVPGSYVASDVDYDDIAAELPLHLRLDTSAGRSTLEGTPPGIAGIAARMLGLAHDAMTDGTWQRIKTCGNKDDCRWAFLDRSKNGSRVWCDMSSCGAAAKAETYRAKQRARRAAQA
ncbi:MAG TPA: CGNR zinc finger domain-containing protein [Dehalococcoidia bacterium]|nr:CGNR zinc finger domain-containing protein [Dehalococcoidia bacterium]